MADNVELNSGSGGATLATDDVGGVQYQRVKVNVGADGAAADVSDANPMPVDDAGGSLTVDDGGTTLSVDDGAGSLTVDGTVTADAGTGPWPVTDNGGSLTVDDGGGSLTIDGTVSVTGAGALAVVGGGAEATALRVTLANDSTGLVSVDDNGGSLTVDGTVTANLSATDNAVLDNIDSNTDYGQVTGGGVEASALRVTLASDSTGVLTVDDGGSTLSIDDGGGAITVDGTVTANAGTNLNTSALALESGGNLATLAALSNAEDAAHNTGDTGVQALAVRNDSDASLCDTTGDYTPLQVDSNGYLKVNIKAGAGSGGTASTDDAAFTAGSGSGTPMMGFATSDTVDAGDVGVLAMDTARNLKVSIEADNVGIGGGTQYTEDDAAAANPVGNMGMAVRADSLGAVTSTDGDNIALRATNNGELYVKQTDAVPVTDNGGSLTIDNAGITTIAGAVSGTEMQCDIVTSALPSGAATAANQSTGNTALAAIQTAVEIIDDWDETNRCAVNLIPGQAGIAAGTGVDGVTVPRVTLATNVALPAGTNAIGKLAANSGVDIGDVDVTSIAAGSNLIGDVGISGARTSGGTTLYKNIDVDESEDQVKGSGGQIYWLHAMNLTAAVLYLQIYNATAASVTVGTTTPDLTFPIPTQGDTNGAGFVLSIPNGIAFSTAITIACTTTATGSGGPAANGCFVNLGYA